MPLTTLDRVKAYLGPSYISSTSEDAFISDLISMKQAEVENYCQRHFDLNSYTETHRINHIICPNEYPIKSVENIVVIVNNSSYGITDYTIFNNYIKLLDMQYLTMGGKLQYVSNENKDIQITYTAGYDPDKIPLDITLACTKLVVLEYKESRQNSLGLDSESEGDVRYGYSKREVPSNILSVLDKYKRKNFI